MVVFHLISSEGYYGAESMLVALARAQSSLGCRCVVGVFRDSRRAHLEVADCARTEGLAVEIVPCNGRWDWKSVGHIRTLLGRWGADVLHTHGYKADLYGYVAAWPRRAARVSTCHNWPDRRPIMRAYATLDRLVLRGFDKVAAASDPVAGVLKLSGIRDARAVSNGVDVPRFCHATPALRDGMPDGCDRLVGFVGRLVEEKGGAILIHSAKHVIAARPGTAFAFIGEGPSRPAWRALASDLGIADHVVFTGVRNDMPEVYASLDLLALPSWIEATPMCLLEGMAAGRPVIATRAGAVAKVVIPGVTGVLLEPGDVRGLAEAILDSLAHPDRASRMAEQGRAHVAKHFSAEAMAAAYIDLYQQALAGDSGQQAWRWSRP